jgi:hypothetical protein
MRSFIPREKFSDALSGHGPFRNRRKIKSALEAAEKGRFDVIPNEVRNPSCLFTEQKERFLVAVLLGMTPFLHFSATCLAAEVLF